MLKVKVCHELYFEVFKAEANKWGERKGNEMNEKTEQEETNKKRARSLKLKR